MVHFEISTCELRRIPLVRPHVVTHAGALVRFFRQAVRLHVKGATVREEETSNGQPWVQRGAAPQWRLPGAPTALRVLEEALQCQRH